MDSKLFRLPQNPNLFAEQAATAPWKESVTRSRAGVPAEDSRFPGWAAPFSDGRLVTDYRPHCETNIPVKAQEKTRVWMQENAEDIMRISRERMSELTGMAYGVDMTTEPPAEVMVKCTAAGCERKITSATLGIGVERDGAAAPELFGTWTVKTMEQPPHSQVGITRKYEGGRNTPRS